MKKHIRERQERHRQLAQQDAANRCAHCRGPFGLGDPLERWDDESKRYCGYDCLEAAIELEAMREANR